MLDSRDLAPRGSSNTCRIPECGRERYPEYLFCDRCWRLVPQTLKNLLLELNHARKRDEYRQMVVGIIACFVAAKVEGLGRGPRFGRLVDAETKRLRACAEERPPPAPDDRASVQQRLRARVENEVSFVGQFLRPSNSGAALLYRVAGREIWIPRLAVLRPPVSLGVGMEEVTISRTLAATKGLL